MMLRSFTALAITVALSVPALAKDQCWDRREGEYPNNMFLNMVFSDQWRDAVNQADAKAMAALSGVWYGEQYAPSLGMTDKQYRSFEANGLFQYQSETCGTVAIPCSKNYGTGQWVAHMQSGYYVVMMHFDDLTQKDRCGGFAARLEGNTMYAQDGSNWQRVR